MNPVNHRRGLARLTIHTLCPAPLSPRTPPSPQAKPAKKLTAKARTRSKKPSDTTERELEKFEHILESSGAASQTVRSYKSAIRKLAAWLNTELAQATPEQLDAYITYCLDERQASHSTVNVAINAIRIFYSRIQSWSEDHIRLQRPRKHRNRPNACTEADANRMLYETLNPKHRLILTMMYRLQLRKDEILNLRKADITPQTGKCLVRARGKRPKRTIVIPKPLMEELNSYLKRYSPQEYVFEGQHGGRYSATSIQQIFVRAKIRSKMPERLTLSGFWQSGKALP